MFLAMGRNYYCEYCDKRMKNDLNVRKKHIDGLPHKIAKAEYMAPFRDPEEILATESSKTPCPRFHGGKECKFGLYCHFSHYTRQQLEELSLMIKNKLETKIERVAADSVSDNHTIKKNIALKIWKYPDELLKYPLVDLPPSLQPPDLSKAPVEFTHWG